MMHLVGFIGAILIGLSLGLIGGGGSILTIPVLVYLFGYSPVTAATYSLFVVGAASSVGALSHSKMGDIDWKAVALFGLPSLITVFIVRHWLLAAIPEVLISFTWFTLTKSLAILLLFSVLMIIASIKMIKPSENISEKIEGSVSSIIIKGLILGVVTGLLGAGGGFLIIPTLVLMMGLSIKKAIGSSLMIITINSAIGFLGSLQHETIEWLFLLEFTAIAVAGIVAGTLISKKISAKVLRPAFGWFILVNGVYIIVHELFLHR
jgi:uncharacterized membrane protein YfcA